jgi:anti-anti-sigma regulatory factor
VLQLEDRDHDNAVVVVPTGWLDVGTYGQLRDHLIKIGAGGPRAVVVDLTGLGISSDASLAIFPSVRTRLQQWPGVPLLLVTGTESIDDLLRRHRMARFVPVHDTVGHAIDAIDDPPLRRVVQLRLPNALTSPRVARRFARDTCVRWGHTIVADDVVLLLCELVTNAVVHTTSEPLVRLELRRGMFSVAVYDDMPGQVSIRDPGGDAGGLHGLLLVAQVAAMWGCFPTSTGGKVVWATLRAG